MINRDLKAYYAQRASEYDRIYARPERQADLGQLKTYLSACFKGLDVLEIACGTGYWTQFIAESARSILATDFNAEMLQIAAGRDYPKCLLSFSTVDAFNLQNVPPGKNAGFGGFIWSHVSKTRRPKLIHSFHSRLKDNSPVIWVDNRYVEGSSTAISRRDSAGNTYQIRLLTDGSRHEIIKNYPLEEELRQDFKPFARNIKVNYFQYYWLLSYNVKKDRLDIPDPAKNENSKFKTRKLS